MFLDLIVWYDDREGLPSVQVDGGMGTGLGPTISINTNNSCVQNATWWYRPREYKGRIEQKSYKNPMIKVIFDSLESVKIAMWKCSSTYSIHYCMIIAKINILPLANKIISDYQLIRVIITISNKRIRTKLWPPQFVAISTSSIARSPNGCPISLPPLIASIITWLNMAGTSNSCNFQTLSEK